MKNDQILSIMNDIDFDMVEDAVSEKEKPAARKRITTTVIAAAAVVALAVAAVPIVNGILKNSPAVVPIIDTSSTPAPVSSDASPVDSTPSGNDPVSAIIPPVSSDTQLVIDPVSDVTTEPVSSEAPPVSSVHDPVSAIIPPVSSDTPSKNDPVSSDPPVSSTPDPISSDSPVAPTQPIMFDNAAAMRAFLADPDLKSYREEDAAAYRLMVDTVNKAGHVYEPRHTAAQRTVENVTLYPMASCEDIGVGYYLTLDGVDYGVIVYNTKDISYTTGDYPGYLAARMGWTDYEALSVRVNGRDVYFKDHGSIQAAGGFLDDEHYFIARAQASRDTFETFLSGLSFEQIALA